MIRIALQGVAAEAATRQAEPRLIDEMESIHRQLDEAKIARNARQATIQNRAFHFRLYEAATLPAQDGKTNAPPRKANGPPQRAARFSSESGSLY